MTHEFLIRDLEQTIHFCSLLQREIYSRELSQPSGHTRRVPCMVERALSPSYLTEPGMGSHLSRFFVPNFFSLSRRRRRWRRRRRYSTRRSSSSSTRDPKVRTEDHFCIIIHALCRRQGTYPYLGTQGVRVMNPPPGLRIPL